MPTVTIPSTGEMNFQDSKEIENYLAKLVKEMTWLLGNLDTLNIKRLDAKVIKTGTLDANVVTIAAEDGSKYYRFDENGMVAFNGSVNTLLFDLVTGLMTLTSVIVQSAAGYPKVALNSDNNLIAAYADPDTYIAFIPQGTDSVPTLVLVDGGTTVGFLNRVPIGGTTLGTFGSEPLNFQPGGGLKIDGVSGYNDTFSYVKDVVAGVPSYGSVTVKKGIITSVT